MPSKPNMDMQLSWTQRAWENESGTRIPQGEQATITVGPRIRSGAVTLAHLEALIQEAIQQGASMDTPVKFDGGVPAQRVGVTIEKPPSPEAEEPDTGASYEVK